MEIEGIKRYTAKFSPDKQTYPGAKQVFRFAEKDVIGCHWECPSCPAAAAASEALLRPVLLNGELAGTVSTAAEARERARVRIAALPQYCRSLDHPDRTYPVAYSQELLTLSQKVQAV
jgi:hypothetical protein